MAKGQVGPYMAVRFHHVTSEILKHSTDRALAGKQLIGTSIVHTEKSLSCSFYHTFGGAGQNCVGQVESKVYLPYLASAFKTFKCCSAGRTKLAIFNFQASYFSRASTIYSYYNH